ncbi:uncharacterized protein [Panulirus ornatus]|uniref:uncharacterized protein n=1 Tax=Panulirus ornatus TaxID=150431 RepID=UPI003A8446E5
MPLSGEDMPDVEVRISPECSIISKWSLLTCGPSRWTWPASLAPWKLQKGLLERKKAKLKRHAREHATVFPRLNRMDESRYKNLRFLPQLYYCLQLLEAEATNYGDRILPEAAKADDQDNSERDGSSNLDEGVEEQLTEALSSSPGSHSLGDTWRKLSPNDGSPVLAAYDTGRVRPQIKGSVSRGIQTGHVGNRPRHSLSRYERREQEAKHSYQDESRSRRDPPPLLWRNGSVTRQARANSSTEYHISSPQTSHSEGSSLASITPPPGNTAKAGASKDYDVFVFGDDDELSAGETQEHINDHWSYEYEDEPNHGAEQDTAELESVHDLSKTNVIESSGNTVREEGQGGVGSSTQRFKARHRPTIQITQREQRLRNLREDSHHRQPSFASGNRNTTWKQTEGTRHTNEAEQDLKTNRSFTLYKIPQRSKSVIEQLGPQSDDHDNALLPDTNDEIESLSTSTMSAQVKEFDALPTKNTIHQVKTPSSVRSTPSFTTETAVREPDIVEAKNRGTSNTVGKFIAPQVEFSVVELKNIVDPLSSHRIESWFVNTTNNVGYISDATDDEEYKIYEPFTLPSAPSSESPAVNVDDNERPPAASQARQLIKENELQQLMRENLDFTGYWHAQAGDPHLEDYLQDRKISRTAQVVRPKDNVIDQHIFESAQDIIEKSAREEWGTKSLGTVRPVFTPVDGGGAVTVKGVTALGVTPQTVIAKAITNEAITTAIVTPWDVTPEGGIARTVTDEPSTGDGVTHSVISKPNWVSSPAHTPSTSFSYFNFRGPQIKPTPVEATGDVARSSRFDGHFPHTSTAQSFFPTIAPLDSNWELIPEEISHNNPDVADKGEDQLLRGYLLDRESHRFATQNSNSDSRGKELVPHGDRVLLESDNAGQRNPHGRNDGLGGKEQEGKEDISDYWDNSFFEDFDDFLKEHGINDDAFGKPEPSKSRLRPSGKTKEDELFSESNVNTDSRRDLSNQAGHLRNHENQSQQQKNRNQIPQQHNQANRRPQQQVQPFDGVQSLEELRGFPVLNRGTTRDRRPNQGPPRDIHPNQGPPRDIHLNQGPPRDIHSNQGPPRDIHPNQSPPRDIHPHQGPPRDIHPNQGPPRDIHLNQGPPRDIHPNQGPPRDIHLNQGPPRDIHLNQGPPRDIHPNQGPPRDIHLNQGPLRDIHTNQGPPRDIHTNQGPPRDIHTNQGPPQSIIPNQVPARDININHGPFQNIQTNQGPLLNKHQNQGTLRDTRQYQGLTHEISPTQGSLRDSQQTQVQLREVRLTDVPLQGTRPNHGSLRDVHLIQPSLPRGEENSFPQQTIANEVLDHGVDFTQGRGPPSESQLPRELPHLGVEFTQERRPPERFQLSGSRQENPDEIHGHVDERLKVRNHRPPVPPSHVFHDDQIHGKDLPFPPVLKSFPPISQPKEVQPQSLSLSPPLLFETNVLTRPHPLPRPLHLNQRESSFSDNVLQEDHLPGTPFPLPQFSPPRPPQFHSTVKTQSLVVPHSLVHPQSPPPHDLPVPPPAAAASSQVFNSSHPSYVLDGVREANTIRDTRNIPGIPGVSVEDNDFKMVSEIGAENRPFVDVDDLQGLSNLELRKKPGNTPKADDKPNNSLPQLKAQHQQLTTHLEPDVPSSLPTLVPPLQRPLSKPTPRPTSPSGSSPSSRSPPSHPPFSGGGKFRGTRPRVPHDPSGSTRRPVPSPQVVINDVLIGSAGHPPADTSIPSGTVTTLSPGNTFQRNPGNGVINVPGKLHSNRQTIHHFVERPVIRENGGNRIRNDNKRPPGHQENTIPISNQEIRRPVAINPINRPLNFFGNDGSGRPLNRKPDIAPHISQGLSHDELTTGQRINKPQHHHLFTGPPIEHLRPPPAIFSTKENQDPLRIQSYQHDGNDNASGESSLFAKENENSIQNAQDGRFVAGHQHSQNSLRSHGFQHFNSPLRHLGSPQHSNRPAFPPPALPLKRPRLSPPPPPRPKPNGFHLHSPPPHHRRPKVHPPVRIPPSTPLPLQISSSKPRPHPSHIRNQRRPPVPQPIRINHHQPQPGTLDKNQPPHIRQPPPDHPSSTGSINSHFNNISPFDNKFESGESHTRESFRFPSGNEIENDFKPMNDVSQPLPGAQGPQEPRMSESFAKMMKDVRFGVNGELLDIWIPIVTKISNGPLQPQSSSPIPSHTSYHTTTVAEVLDVRDDFPDHTDSRDDFNHDIDADDLHIQSSSPLQSGSPSGSSDMSAEETRFTSQEHFLPGSVRGHTAVPSFYKGPRFNVADFPVVKTVTTENK